MNRDKVFYGWLSADAPESCDYIAPIVIKIIEQMYPKKESVLDIGSGNGFLCSQLSKLGYHVVGMEPDEQGFEISKRNYPNIKFYNLGVDSDSSSLIQENKGRFDVAVSTEVIEHLYSPRQILQFAGKALKDDGCLIISTPYHGYLKNLALAITGKWDFHHHPLVDGGHIKFWSRRTLSQLLNENGFAVVDFHGVGRLPYLWKSMILVAKKHSGRLWRD